MPLLKSLNIAQSLQNVGKLSYILCNGLHNPKNSSSFTTEARRHGELLQINLISVN